jgi:antitoxin component YwqK of YwqJK toxin-antitoxin module
MNRVWYCKLADRTLGPLSLEELRELVSQGELRSDSKVRNVTESGWKPARTVRGLFGARRAKPPAETPSPETSPSQELAVPAVQESILPIEELDTLLAAPSAAPARPLAVRPKLRKQPSNHRTLLAGIGGALATLVIGGVIALFVLSGDDSPVVDSEAGLAANDKKASVPPVSNAESKNSDSQNPPSPPAPPKSVPPNDVQDSSTVPAAEPQVDASAPTSKTGNTPTPAPPQEPPAKKPDSDKPVENPPLGETKPIMDLSEPFPSGRSYSPEAFVLDSRATVSMMEKDDPAIVVITHSNGKPYAIATQKNGRLHGVTYGQHPNGKPMVYINYENGRREGLMKTWDDKGGPVLFAEYQNGRREGFTCLFDGAELAMIAEYDFDVLECERLVASHQVIAEFLSEEDALADENGAKHLEDLEALETEIKTNEVALKRQVREYDEQLRRSLASARSFALRGNASRRYNNRQAADAAIRREIIRSIGLIK